MKIRTGFVSNSSSSSFIIDNVNDNQDKVEKIKKLIDESKYNYSYITLNNKLYTSFISDGNSDFYSDISELADRDIDGGHGGPYDVEDFVEVDDNLWVPYEELTEEQLKEYNTPTLDEYRTVYLLCKNFLENELTAKELKTELSYLIKVCEE